MQPAAAAPAQPRKAVPTGAVMAPGATDLSFFIRPMIRHPDVPDLVERYMTEIQSPACWVTVRDIRARFNLDESAGPAISGFLKKIYQGPYFSCRYKVSRIEKFRDTLPPNRLICRYLVEERPSYRCMQAARTRSLPAKDPVTK